MSCKKIFVEMFLIYGGGGVISSETAMVSSICDELLYEDLANIPFYRISAIAQCTGSS